MRDFKKFNVWNEAHEIVKEIYNLLNKLPKEEAFNIKDQLRRAVTSIPTNIAEGCGRGSDQDFIRFLNIANGSVSEVQYLLILSKDLGYINSVEQDKLDIKLLKVKMMLIALIKQIRNRN